MRALLIAIACLLVGHSVAAAQTTAPQKRTVQLTRMGSSIPEGDLDTRFQFGVTCSTDRSQSWSSVNSRFSDEHFKRAFRETMVDSSIPTPGDGGRDLFSEPGGRVDLEVGAMVRSLRLRTCTKSDGRDASTEGSAYMDIQWQVYSVEEGKVVAKISTFGSYSTEAPIDTVVDRLLSGAFRRAAHDLAYDTAFARLVRPKADAIASAAAPLSPLVIALAPPHDTAIAKVSAGVVSIVLSDSHGSGVLITPDGYILTNHHVAGSSGKVRVVWADGSETPGEVVRADRKRDVALIKVAAPNGRPLAIRHTPVQVAETVYAIGTPLERDLAGTLTRGVVSATRIDNGQPIIQSDVAISHGNSGGPLLDERGRIVGLARSGILIGGEAQIGLNFFIPIDDALRALALKPVETAPVAAARRPVATSRKK